MAERFPIGSYVELMFWGVGELGMSLIYGTNYVYIVVYCL